MALGVVGLEAQPDGDPRRGIPPEAPRPRGRSRRTRSSPHGELRVALGLRQEVERDVVGEGDLREPALDRPADEIARGAAGVAAAERVDVVVGRVPARPDYRRARRLHTVFTPALLESGHDDVGTEDQLRSPARSGSVPVSGFLPGAARGRGRRAVPASPSRCAARRRCPCTSSFRRRCGARRDQGRRPEGACAFPTCARPRKPATAGSPGGAARPRRARRSSRPRRTGRHPVVRVAGPRRPASHQSLPAVRRLFSPCLARAFAPGAENRAGVACCSVTFTSTRPTRTASCRCRRSWTSSAGPATTSSRSPTTSSTSDSGLGKIAHRIRHSLNPETWKRYADEIAREAERAWQHLRDAGDARGRDDAQHDQPATPRSTCSRSASTSSCRPTAIRSRCCARSAVARRRVGGLPSRTR